MPKNPEFGRLLSQGINAIKARQDKPKGIIQDEIGFELERDGGRSAVQYWEKGNSPGVEEVEYLAKICVVQGGMDQAWLRRFLQTARHPIPEALINALFPAESRIAQNLPRRDYIEFVGRQSELQKIAAWLLHRVHILTVDGIGGIGKSALALEAAYRFLERIPPFIIDAPYEAIVWVSAKQDLLTLDGVIPRPNFFRTLDDIYTALADVLKREDILRSQPKDQGRLVDRILREHTVWLIVDNLESVDDTRVLGFLHDLPWPSKALVTTRERIHFADPMRLTRLNREESFRLINLIIACNLTAEEKDKLHQRTGGIPLALTLTVAKIKAGFPVERVLADLGNAQGNIVQYCIQSSIDALQSEDALRILLALSLFAVNAGYDGLKAVAGFDKDSLSFEDALARLQQLSLIDEVTETPESNETALMRSPQRYALLPPTRAYAFQRLAGEPALKQAMIDRQTAYYTAMLSDIGYDYTPDNWQKLKTLDQERDNLFGLLTFLYEEKAWKSIIHILAYLYGYLSFRGHWNDYLEWGEQIKKANNALERAGNNDNDTKRAFAWYLSEECWVLINHNELELATSVGQQAHALFQLVGERNGQARTLRHFGVIQRRNKNYKKAREYYRKALHIWQQEKNEREISSIYNNLGLITLEEKDFSQAEELFLKSLEMKRSQNDIPRLGNTLYYLGSVYLEQERLTSAKQYFSEANEITQISGDVLFAAKTSFSLAKIAQIEESYDKMQGLATRSKNLFAHLKMEDEHQEVKKFLKEVAK